MDTRLRDMARLIPPLSSSLRKGQSGKVGVAGGSQEYSGAVYFAAITALRMGADLCHVFCDPAAAGVVKGYSPDLIVHPFISQRVNETLPRLHSLLLGPGLGRNPDALSQVELIIKEARSLGMPITIDADGLFLIKEKPQLIQDYTRAILTPNENEFRGLCEAVDIKYDVKNDELTQLLARKMGVCIVRKGRLDTISDGSKTWITDLNEKDCPRRCGGQGDILAGAITTFLAWNECRMKGHWGDDCGVIDDANMLCALAGCMMTRVCSRMAYARAGRSVSAITMIECLHLAFSEFEKICSE